MRSGVSRPGWARSAACASTAAVASAAAWTDSYPGLRTCRRCRWGDGLGSSSRLVRPNAGYGTRAAGRPQLEDPLAGAVHLVERLQQRTAAKVLATLLSASQPSSNQFRGSSGDADSMHRGSVRHRQPAGAVEQRHRSGRQPAAVAAGIATRSIWPPSRVLDPPAGHAAVRLGRHVDHVAQSRAGFRPLWTLRPRRRSPGPCRGRTVRRRGRRPRSSPAPATPSARRPRRPSAGRPAAASGRASTRRQPGDEAHDIGQP